MFSLIPGRTQLFQTFWHVNYFILCQRVFLATGKQETSSENIEGMETVKYFGLESCWFSNMRTRQKQNCKAIKDSLIAETSHGGKRSGTYVGVR